MMQICTSGARVEFHSVWIHTRCYIRRVRLCESAPSGTFARHTRQIPEQNANKRLGRLGLTAARRHRRDLQRVRVGGGDGLLLVLRGHFDGLADERQLLAGDDVVVHRAVSACGRRG